MLRLFSKCLSPASRFAVSGSVVCGSALLSTASSSSSSSSSSQSSTTDLTKVPVTPNVSTRYPNTTDETSEEISGIPEAYSHPKQTRYSHQIQPPKAMKIPTVTRLPWDTLTDHYGWMRDKSSPNTISYLEAENAYTKACMAHTEELQQELYDEILSRIVEDDTAVPAKRGRYYYYTRTIQGKSYKQYCRSTTESAATDDESVRQSTETVMLDENVIAEGESFLRVGTVSVSPNDNIMAYSTDTTGNEQYDVYFKHLTTNELLSDKISGILGSVVWANDNQTVFYTRVDDSWRPHQLWMHKLGTDATKDDVLIYEEKDLKYRVGISRSLAGDYLFFSCGSSLTDEICLIDANLSAKNVSKEGVPKMIPVTGRIDGVEYDITHHKNDDKGINELIVLTNNDECINFKAYAIDLNEFSKNPSRSLTNQDEWTEVIPHNEDVTLSGIIAFKDFLVVNQRGPKGLSEIKIRPNNIRNESGEKAIEFEDSSYDIWASTGRENLEYDTDVLRYHYTSLIAPETVYDLNVKTGETQTKKIKPVNRFDSSKYTVKLIEATARDGTTVPISMIHRKDLQFPAPVLLIGYGSYGICYDDYFSVSRLSLVDRGMAVAYAKIRGGGEFGRKWKLAGRLQNKRNTFTDFIACSEHLIENGFVKDVDRQTGGLQISGGSAGGMLMGAVMNTRPDLFHSVIANVPFVDVMNTILDETLPLTAGEWEEWGDPRMIDDYFYMKSYSPMENIRQMDYPNILLMGGINDTRVSYWEPAKLCAKLRDLKTDDNLLLLKTIMAAGHGGASGRYAQIKETAFEYSWVLDRAGLLQQTNDVIPPKPDSSSSQS